jgi:uncharacterized protein (TIGR03437 family)
MIMPNRRGWTQIALGAALASLAPAQIQPQNATLDNILAAVNSSLSTPSNDATFTLCQLRAGTWGNYSVTVTVPGASTKSGQPLMFSVSGNGILTQGPLGAGGILSSFASARRNGTIFLPDREVAFARGVPYWIGDVTYLDDPRGSGPFRVQYNVYTNPAFMGIVAHGRFDALIPASQSSDGIGGVYSVSYASFSSSAGAQTFVGSLWCGTPCGALHPLAEYYLSAVGPPLTGPQVCPLSNEVDLGAAAQTRPTFRRHLPVLQAFDNGTRVSSGTWVQIFGERLSDTTRAWRADDFNGSRAPTSLDGVSVNFNGKPAFIGYVSPNQINAQLPDDDSGLGVNLQVVNARGPSDDLLPSSPFFTASLPTRAFSASPAMLTAPSFLSNGKQYLAALFPDLTTFVGPENLVAGAVFRPAKPGDTIVVYAVGCGPASPPSPAGQVPASSIPLSPGWRLAFGVGPTRADALTSGFLVGQALGLCQFNVVVPELPDGDVTVVLTSTAFPVPATSSPLWTTIRH